MTKYEKAVYDIVSRSMEHLTVEQIFRRARDSYPRVALATIYNNVNKLWEAGLIRRVSLEGMPTGTTGSKGTTIWCAGAAEG